MNKYNGKSFGDAMPSFDYVYSGQKERDNQPIEEKWKGSWRWRSDRMGLDKDQHDEILDFIENLLEQEREKSSDAKFHFTNGVLEERKRMSDEIEGEDDILRGAVKEKVLAIINK